MTVKTVLKKILKSRISKKLGLSLINYDLLKYTKHYNWIFKLHKIPTLAIHYNEIPELAQADVKICERLIAAYQKASFEKSRIEKETSKIWSQGIREYANKLVESMETADPEELAKTLSSMFRQDFVYGLSSGYLVEHALSKIGSKIWSLKYQDNVVSLAEYLGVLRTESPQQGDSCFYLNTGLKNIAEGISEKCGFSIDFPDIGAPYGIRIGNNLVTMESPEHIYAALRIQKATQDYLPENLKKDGLDCIEIGAGYGGLAYWMSKLTQLKIKKYTVVDLPIINVLQGYFLSKAFGASRVAFHGEAGRTESIFFVEPVSYVDKKDMSPVGLIINENSMPEMTQASVEKYLQFAKKHLCGIFFSYNHEAHSAVYGRLQISVPETAENVGGLDRLSRNASWLRTGYVEEVYRIKEDKL